VTGIWRGGFFTGDPEGYVREGSGDRCLFPWGPVGEPGSGPYTRDFERWKKGMKLKALDKGTSLNRDPAGEAERGSFTGNFEMWMKGF